MTNAVTREIPIPLLLAAALLLSTGCAATLSSAGRSAADSHDMVYIPGGLFLMGSNWREDGGEFRFGADEFPQRKVRARGFYIDRYEVTEAQYLEFLNATGSKKYPGYWKEAGRADRYPEGFENQPVSDADWFDAEAYCRWAGMRLPTEAEWEKAARGTDGRLWPWGANFAAGKANVLGQSAAWSPPAGQEHYHVKAWKAPVGRHPGDVSPYGVYDMAGNVREWTSSPYRTYPGNPVRKVKESEILKIIRGGSYLTDAESSRTAARLAVLPTVGPRETDGWHSDYTYGFRCARD